MRRAPSLAPTPATAYLHTAAMVKAGVYVWSRGCSRLQQRGGAVAFGWQTRSVSPQWWGPPPDRPRHRAVWHDRPAYHPVGGADPGLLAISVPEVLAAVAQVLDVGVAGRRRPRAPAPTRTA